MTVYVRKSSKCLWALASGFRSLCLHATSCLTKTQFLPCVFLFVGTWGTCPGM